MIYDYIKDLGFKTIIEAGAHLGADTIRLALMFPNAVIRALEPHPRLFKKLRYKTKKYKNIIPENIGLSNYCGRVPFFTERGIDGGANSLLPAGKFYMEYIKKEKTIIINIITLNTYLRDTENIDLLWLDVEGFELYVLQHAPLHKIKYIYTEVTHCELRIGSSKYEDVDRLLTRNGFIQLFIDPPVKENGSNWTSNALYKNETYL